MARAQSCENDVQHIEHLSHGTCRVPHGTKGQFSYLSLTEFKSQLFKIILLKPVPEGGNNKFTRDNEFDQQRLSLWQHAQFSKQIPPWDRRACCWEVQKPGNKHLSHYMNSPFCSPLFPSFHFFSPMAHRSIYFPETFFEFLGFSNCVQEQWTPERSDSDRWWVSRGIFFHVEGLNREPYMSK